MHISYKPVEVAPYWNVNINRNAYDDIANGVEVAPYWNVNKGEKGDPGTASTVEVAPYWNVNEIYETLKNKGKNSRSSTILECK